MESLGNEDAFELREKVAAYDANSPSKMTLQAIGTGPFETISSSFQDLGAAQHISSRPVGRRPGELHRPALRTLGPMGVDIFIDQDARDVLIEKEPSPKAPDYESKPPLCRQPPDASGTARSPQLHGLGVLLSMKQNIAPGDGPDSLSGQIDRTSSKPVLVAGYQAASAMAAGKP